MLKSLVRFSLVSAVALAAMLPLTAYAAGGGGGSGTGMTITIGSPISLQNHLLITVPVTVTCVAPISVDPTTNQPGFIGVSVEQASAGKTVAIGAGGVELDSCSPTPQTFSIQVTPNAGPTTSIPFHGGPAIVSANGVICDFNFPQTCYFTTTPWQATKL